MIRIVSYSMIALAVLGCSSFRDVPRSELSTDSSFGKTRVATVDGFEYRFVRTEVVPDTLVGYYTVTVERSNQKGEYWYEDVLRRHRIPLNRVARVELVRKDPLKTAFYGAGMAAAGFFLVTLVEEKRGEASKGSGGGKGSIDIP
jgi:hypothetical protein